MRDRQSTDLLGNKCDELTTINQLDRISDGANVPKTTVKLSRFSL